MRILLTLLVLLAFPAHALTTAELFSKVCAGSAVNRQLACGVEVQSLSFSTTTQQVTITSDSPVSATAPLFLMFVPTGDPAPTRLDFFGSGVQKITATTDTVNTPLNVAGSLYAAQMRSATFGEVANTAAFTRSATATNNIKWNPGHYFNRNYGDRRYVDNPALLESLLVSTGVCVPGSQVKGIMIRFKSWSIYEPTVGDRVGNNLLDWVLNHFASGDCRGTVDPPRLGVSMYWSTFGNESFLNGNVNAGIPGCVPSDHPEWGLAWKKITSTNGRCIIRMWDQPDGITAINNTIADMGARYNDHPLFEWVNFKGEGSFSISQAGDPVYDADPEGANTILRAEMRNQGTVWRSTAPNTAFTLGSNFYNSTDEAVIQTRVDEQVAFMDATGGIGSQWPDSYSNSNGAPKPRTSWQARLMGFITSATSPRQSKYMHVAETQRGNGPTCNGDVQGCYDWMSKPGFVFTNNNQPQNYVPAQGATDPTSATASHTVWQVQFPDPFSLTNILSVLNAEGYVQWQEACPESWVNAGLTCVTGGT